MKPARTRDGSFIRIVAPVQHFRWHNVSQLSQTTGITHNYFQRIMSLRFLQLAVAEELISGGGKTEIYKFFEIAPSANSAIYHRLLTYLDVRAGQCISFLLRAFGV